MGRIKCPAKQTTHSGSGCTVTELKGMVTKLITHLTEPYTMSMDPKDQISTPWVTYEYSIIGSTPKWLEKSSWISKRNLFSHKMA